MGTVYAEIELINGSDIEKVKRGYIGEEEVRRMPVNMLVDSGAYLMAVNENIRTILQLSFLEKRKLRMANDKVEEYDVVGPIQVKFKNRMCICSAIVLSGDSEPLLGSIPMEELDVLIHPLRQELILHPDHPDGAILRL